MIHFIMFSSALYLVPGYGFRLLVKGKALGHWALPFFIISPVLLILLGYLIYSFYSRCKQIKEERKQYGYGRLTIGLMILLSIGFFILGFYAEF
jgi:hypothetical protein